MFAAAGVAVAEETAEGPVKPSAPWMRDIAPDVATDQLEDPRLVVIILNDAPAGGLDMWVVRTTREMARAIVDQLGPNDLAAVVLTGDNRAPQDFTQDRARLLAAVDRFSFCRRIREQFSRGTEERHCVSRTGSETPQRHLYGRGSETPAPVVMRAESLNTDRAVVFTKTDKLTPTGTSAPRSADYRLDLPLSVLTPDEYVLSIVATLPKGTPIRRDVRFWVQQAARQPRSTPEVPGTDSV